MKCWPIVAASLGLATSAHAQDPLQQGFDGALRGCEEWVLDPASWADGTRPFEDAVGLGSRMGEVGSINEASLPPRPLRVANRYWRINSTQDAGYMLVVSEDLPMCHITGGGSKDLQPVVEATIAGEAFNARWEEVDTQSHDDMITTQYRNREDPSFSLVLSRASSPGGRLDRVQVIATAMMELD